MSRLRRSMSALVLAAGLGLGATGCGSSGVAPVPSPAPTSTAAPSPPPPPPAPGHQILLFVPHADDEVLSMGVFIYDEVADHHDVRLVLYTSGAGTGLCRSDRHGICQAHNHFRHLTTAQFSALRDSELRHSAAALGVPADKIDFYAPNGVRRLDGTVSVGYTLAMLRHYHRFFPAATFVTMSWLDRHPDHAAGGIALRSLVRDVTMPASQALFTMYRRYWAYDYPHRSDAIRRELDQIRVARGYPVSARLLRCPTPGCRAALHRSVLAYYPPALGGTGTGIGFRTASQFLEVTDGDPEVLLHGATTGRYPVRLFIVSVRDEPGQPGVVVVRATVSVPDFGRYGANPDRPASARHLAQSLRGWTVGEPLPPRTVAVLTARDAAGHVLASARALVDGTRATGRMRIPAAAVQLTLTTPGSDGVRPARVSVSLG